MVDILALISSILFTPAFSISFFYETGVRPLCGSLVFFVNLRYNLFVK